MCRRTRDAGTLLAAVLLWMASAPGDAAEEAKPKEAEPVANAQRADRSRFVHRIELKDGRGRVLGPKSLAPYSPRQTCGTANCHDYNTVARGSHTLMFADPRPDPQRPPIHIWTVTDPKTRTQHPLSHGWLPERPEDFLPTEHKTPFALARELGAYHPGGGRFEYDRQGRRYDETLAADLALRDEESNPDYYKARWDQSGVLEIDCLVCHARGLYDHVERGTQISLMNFRWAPTVGAGFGTVEGRVAMLPPSQPPAEGAEAPSPEAEPPIKVHYKPGLFDEHRKVEVDLGRPPDRNCLFCHRKPAQEPTPWSDCWDADVHTKSGLACVDCHRATPWHAIYGSRRHGDLFRTDPDFATLSCQGCHEAGRLGSPVPEHPGLPALHLEKLACEACHAGPHVRRVPLAIEKPTNYLWGTPGAPVADSGPTVWTPVLRREGDQLRPVMRLLPRFFANRTPKGLVPLSTSRVASRIRRIGRYVDKHKDLQEDLREAQDEARKQALIEREKKYRARGGITDAEIQALVADPSPEVVNTETEIAVLLKLLTKKDEDPEDAITPVYFVGGLAYSLDSSAEDPLQWTLRSEPHALAEPIDLPVAHSVRPAAQSLGAQDCTECHARRSAFWRSLGITRGVGPEGEPAGPSLQARLGKSRLDLLAADLREAVVRPYGWIVVLLGVLAMGLHYVVFGPHVYPRPATEEVVQRFHVISRVAHVTLLLSFLVLAVTGFSIAEGVESLLGVGIEALHEVLGFVLAGAVALAFVLWVRDMVFAREDIGWLKVMGGYLGYEGHVPAGRFNAGQKLFFWLIVLVVACLFVTGLVMEYERPARWVTLAHSVHLLAAYFMVLCILGHAYLGSFANPGTLQAPFSGRVTKAWLKYHHPNYAVKVLRDEEKTG